MKKILDKHLCAKRMKGKSWIIDNILDLMESIQKFKDKDTDKI